MKMNIPEPARKIIDRLNEHGYEAYVVGGCVRDMIRIGETRNAVWYSAGKRSKKGHPHHPLYLRKDSVLEPFDVSSYLDHLSAT